MAWRETYRRSMRSFAPVHVGIPFAVLGAAGGVCAAYAEGAQDDLAFAHGSFAWVIPALAGLLFTARLGNTGGELAARWLRPMFVFLAGAVAGVALRLATGVHVDPG